MSKTHSDILREQQSTWFKKEGSEYFNIHSKIQDKDIIVSLEKVKLNLYKEFPQIKLFWNKKIFLKDIVIKLKMSFPKEKWKYLFETSFMTPDGGILFLVDKTKNFFDYPILISEVKHQGTNDKRQNEGLKKQAQGNAVERLGKNVIGFRTWMLNENIFPFVCFGYGWDFNPQNSTIPDRIITINEFGELNKTFLFNTQKTNRGSFYFRQNKWTIDEMYEIMFDIAKRAIHYYFSKYQKENFI